MEGTGETARARRAPPTGRSPSRWPLSRKRPTPKGRQDADRRLPARTPRHRRKAAPGQGSFPGLGRTSSSTSATRSLPPPPNGGPTRTSWPSSAPSIGFKSGDNPQHGPARLDQAPSVRRRDGPDTRPGPSRFAALSGETRGDRKQIGPGGDLRGADSRRRRVGGLPQVLHHGHYLTFKIEHHSSAADGFAGRRARVRRPNPGRPFAILAIDADDQVPCSSGSFRVAGRRRRCSRVPRPGHLTSAADRPRSRTRRGRGAAARARGGGPGNARPAFLATIGELLHRAGFRVRN